ncbi:uncharacterized protein SCHCODRAFT_02088871 [Schizophyllum commune H4-8]|uniref:uncharacterized protein n=1 Tax=Schizophyllum commune (strain H4-8 / FGSC 9210) TaxID=578458 RepID=UPI002160C0FF|nr:uncharacterized protein SCHCODRAFT_02088871 [Schizophyllum commune H4-8]KAI5887110.1 hypothetical protein SCHCODRAFT_02088871 [Schizophyllum commune H4-8]
MPATRDISRPIIDTARVTAMLFDALSTYYANLGAPHKRRTPLALAPRDRRAGIAKKTTLLLAQECMTLTPVRERGRQELETALKRAAFTMPYLRASPPAVLQAVVDSLSSPNAVTLEARSYRRDALGQGGEDPTTALYALITAITSEYRGQVILDAWVARNLVPVMKAIMHIPATLAVTPPTPAQAQEPMIPLPTRKRKAALMGSPRDVSQRANAPDFDRPSDMVAGSSHAEATMAPAPAWTVSPRSPSTTSWGTPFSARNSTTWGASPSTLDMGSPPWVPILASPDHASGAHDIDPALQHAATAFQGDTPSVQDADSFLREALSAFHDVGLIFRGDTSNPQDSTPNLQEADPPLGDISSEALNSHWAFWDGDVTEDDVMTNLTVWDAHTNSEDALTLLEDAASAFGGLAAVSTPTYNFGKVKSIFETSSSHFEVADTASASVTSTPCGDGSIGLSATDHLDWDAAGNADSSSTWDTSISAAWDALHAGGYADNCDPSTKTFGSSSAADLSTSSFAEFSSSHFAVTSSSLSSISSSASSYATSSSSSSVDCNSSSFGSSNSSLDDSSLSPPALAAHMTCIGGAPLHMLSALTESQL